MKQQVKLFFFCRLTFLCLFIFCLFPHLSLGQDLVDNGTMKLWGTVLAEPTKKPLGGVTISLYKGPIKIKTTTTDKAGKFILEVGSNTGEYKMIFSCPAYLNMYCLVNTSVPENKLPLSSGHEFIGVPMWPANTSVINIYALKENPFSKIYLQGKKLEADVQYLNWFSKKLFDMKEMETKKEAEEKEKLAKEKQEKEKQEKLNKEKEFLAKMEKEKLAKELAEKEKQKKEQEEQEKLKTENEKKNVSEKETNVVAENKSSTLENEQIKLKKEKEFLEQQKKNNQKVKSEYEGEMLKIVAENEKRQKEQQFLNQKQDAESNSIAERMKREQELKAKLNLLKIQITTLENQNKNLYNIQKQQQLKTLIETTATIEREIKILASNNTENNPSSYKIKSLPKIETKIIAYTFSTEIVTTITYNSKTTEYKKQEYWWGTYYYKDDKEIDESVYVKEINKYKAGN